MKHTMPKVDSDATSLPSHPGQIPQAGAALQQHENGGDQTAAKQAAPEQDRPRVERQQPREERRGAPGHGSADDECNA
jgi:hypothetical protein